MDLIEGLYDSLGVMPRRSSCQRSHNTGQLFLPISSSTQHGGGYLDHAEDEIRNVVGKLRFLFIPYAAARPPCLRDNCGWSV